MDLLVEKVHFSQTNSFEVNRLKNQQEMSILVRQSLLSLFYEKIRKFELKTIIIEYIQFYKMYIAVCNETSEIL